MSLYTITFETDSEDFSDENETKKPIHSPLKPAATPHRFHPNYTPVKITKQDLSAQPSPPLNHSYDFCKEKPHPSYTKDSNHSPTFRRTIIRKSHSHQRPILLNNQPKTIDPTLSNDNHSKNSSNDEEIPNKFPNQNNPIPNYNNDNQHQESEIENNQNENKESEIENNQNENKEIEVENNQNENKEIEVENNQNENKEIEVENNDNTLGHNSNDPNNEGSQLKSQQDNSEIEQLDNSIETVELDPVEKEKFTQDILHQLNKLERDDSLSPVSFVIHRQNSLKLFGKKFNFSLNLPNNQQLLIANFNKSNSNIINILKGQNYDLLFDEKMSDDTPEVAALLFSPTNDSFSLRQRNQYGVELMSIRIRNSQQDSVLQKSHRKGYFKVYFFFENINFPKSLSGFNYQTFEDCRFPTSSKNILLGFQNDNFVLINKMEKNTLFINKFGQLPDICAFVLGIATFLYTK